MGTPTITTTAERIGRYREHVARYWPALDASEEQADLAQIVTENALGALAEGDATEAAVWTKLGELRVTLRAKAWK